MAGDWIKVRHDLPSDPAVIAIAAQIQASEDEVVGKLIRFWIWGDQQTRDGNAPGVTKTFLDRYLGVTGFADAMESVGWLLVESGGVNIPKFERHISQSAKSRALTARRAAKCKAQKGNGQSVTRALPREEKRREEKKDHGFDPLRVRLPVSLQSEAFAEAWADWVVHRREIRKKLTPTSVAKQLKALEAMGRERAIRAIEHTIEMGWVGIREPDPPRGDGKLADFDVSKLHLPSDQE